MITLSGYETIIANEVFGRNIEAQAVSPGGNGHAERVIIKEVLMPERYTFPTEDEVLAHLQKTAESVEGAAALILPGGVNRSQQKSFLEKTIIELPEEIRRHIRTRNEKCLSFIRGYVDVPVLGEGELSPRYLHLTSGLIPETTIESNADQGRSTDPNWYRIALNHESLRKKGLGKQWEMRILLTEGLLPEETDVDVLVKHGTEKSRTLLLSGLYSFKEVSEALKAVYQGLSSRDQLNLLTDSSRLVLEQLALQPVIALHDYVQAKEAATQQIRR